MQQSTPFLHPHTQGPTSLVTAAEITLSGVKPLRLGHEWFHSQPALANANYLQGFHLIMKLGKFSDDFSQELRCGLQRAGYLSLVMAISLSTLSKHVGQRLPEGQPHLLHCCGQGQADLDPPLVARCSGYEDVMPTLGNREQEGSTLEKNIL